MNEIIKINRDLNKNAYKIDISISDNWQLFRSDKEKPIFLKEGVGSGSFTIENLENKRIFFLLQTEKHGTIKVAEKHIALDGAFNLRDLGGYITKDKKSIKQGMIFRSDDLASLSESDLDYIESFHLSSVIDFRSQEEIKAANDKYLENVKFHQYSIVPAQISVGSMDEVLKMTKEQADEYMRDVYRLLVSETCSNQYRNFFKILQSESQKSVLYHCSAGKDRTGMATVFILYALGVDMKTILKDYMWSNELLTKKYEKQITKHPHLEALFTVKEEYIDIVMNEITKLYKTVDNYLINVLEIDFELMKKKFLY